MTLVDSAVPIPDETATAADDCVSEPRESHAEVYQDDGHVTIVLPAGEVITGGIAAQAAKEFEGLAGTGFSPLLLELTGVESLTRTARKIFGAARNASAVAVVGSSQVDRVIANFLLGGDLPPCPTRYFSSKSDALNWLRGKAR
ncbi:MULTISPECIES: STAS/SEC14 domain-containing protein [unclassified Arthrobacter]|uniref:DUF7793 family protein n=1 Tax=unclassified Arthrobacter TaxID=235627 RepID=UPI00128EDA77|nr:MULTISPECIES: STAS/SEC14 domain-containing protein [unclassified Arthrobacter]MSR98722.1 STAS/SEC14 domain-containing protein [Arthrobacter sp. BL-252-APC-1A]